MKLIRAIFRHSFLLAIVIGAGFAYYYRDAWLPQFYESVADLRGLSEEYFPHEEATVEPAAPGEDATSTPAIEAGAPTSEAGGETAVAEAPVTAARQEALSTPAGKAGPARTAEGNAQPVTDDTGSVASSDVATRQKAVSPAREPAAAAPAKPVPDLSRYRPLEEDEADGESVPDAEQGQDSALDTAETPEKEGASASVIASQIAGDGTSTGVGSGTAPVVAMDAREKLRADARSAFWRHDYQQAEQDYKALAEMDPDDPDAWGELGNLYFSQGKWDMAADAFYEAGIRLVRMGEVQRAGNLLAVIRGLDPEKAQQLEQQLSQSPDGAGN